MCCRWSEETLENYQKHQEEGYDVPDANYEAWLHSLPSAMDSSKEQSGTSVPAKGAAPSTSQALDKSLQFPMLPLAGTSPSCGSSQGGQYSISSDEAHPIQPTTVGQA